MEKVQRMDNHLRCLGLEIQRENDDTYLVRGNERFGKLTYFNDRVALLNMNGEPVFSYIDNSKDNNDKVSIYFCEEMDNISIHTVYSWDNDFASIKKSFHGDVKGQVSLEVFHDEAYFSYITTEKNSSIRIILDEETNSLDSVFVKEKEGLITKEESFERNYTTKTYTTTTTLLPIRNGDLRQEIETYSYDDPYSYSYYYRLFMKKERVQRVLSLMQDFIDIYCPNLSKELVITFSAYAHLMDATKTLPKKKERKQ